VLNVVRDAPPKGLNGEAKQSSFDGNTVPGWRVSIPRNMHETRGPGGRIQESVAVIDLPCSSEQRVEGYPELRLPAEVNDVVSGGNSAGVGYTDVSR